MPDMGLTVAMFHTPVILRPNGQSRSNSDRHNFLLGESICFRLGLTWKQTHQLLDERFPGTSWGNAKSVTHLKMDVTDDRAPSIDPSILLG
jgi:hypothetical protein